jgi:sodium-independent sulfate anion transporter 11
MAAVMATPEFQNGTWTIAHVTSNLTLVSGLICLLVGVLRLGILFDFICQPAIAGFMAGSGLTIVVNQVRKKDDKDKVCAFAHIFLTSSTR